MRARLALAGLAAAGAAVAAPVVASAHALPQTEVPAEGSTVQQAPADVEITFGETPDPQLSSITVINDAGSSVTAGPTSVVPGHPAELEVPLQPHLPNGVYTVTWKTVSSVDGHIATGAYAFGVGVSAAAANGHAHSSVVSPPPSPLAIAARLLLFAGAMLVLGVAAMSLWALREVPRYARLLLTIGLVLVAAGSLGIIEGQREAAGVGLGTLFSTSLGAQAVARLAGLGVLLALGIAGLRLRGRLATALLWLTAAASVAVMWIDVQYSHAGAQDPVWANYITQLVHIGAAGVWIGGLVLLVIAVRAAEPGARMATARRFSTVFGVCIALVAVTGTFRAVIEIGSWAALVSTAFGVLVLVKVGLFLALASLGAVNRWVHVPNAHRLLRRFRRFIRMEVVVGVAVVAVAAALVNVAPPLAGGLAATPAQQQQQVVVTGSDFATTVRLTLTVTPGVAGFNTFTARVADFDTGQPVDAQEIVLQFTNPLRSNVAPSSLTLRRTAAGVFSARGAGISLDGIWELQAVIENGLASTEVHLQLITDEPPPQTTQTLIPTGAGNQTETVYTVQLSQGRTVQVYVQKSGPLYEFHVTMFAAGGTGEVQTSAMTIGETQPGGTPTVLVARRIDDIGHWVADATKPAKGTRFDIIATLPTGEVLATYVIINAGS